MILVIGEILHDIFPGFKRIGGAPFNFAFHLRHLGFDVRFISRVGTDDPGRQIIEFITGHGFDSEDVQQDADFATGRVEVTMAHDGSHQFSIVKNMAYDRIEKTRRLKGLCQSSPRLVYFGTLIQRTPAGRKLIASLMDDLPEDTLKFCDINLRPDCWTRQVVDDTVAAADILKLSQEELDILVPETCTPGNAQSIEDRAACLLNAPGPQKILVTLGEKGSLMVSDKGVIRPVTKPDALPRFQDSVGAGDAYAAMAAGGFLSGLSDDRALELAHEFAAGICQIKGALPRNPDFYASFLARLSHGR